jgi:transaldolase
LDVFNWARSPVVRGRRSNPTLFPKSFEEKRGDNIMASKTKKTKAARKRKKKPNKANLKKDQKRIERNREILRELEEKDES